MIRRSSQRKGMSLLEVIIALATFLMSITGLVFLMGIATENAIQTQMRSQALSLCQSKLAEVTSGALPLSGSPKAECEDDKDYQWSMDVTPGSFGSLSTVTVTVSRKRANGKEFECSMSQMVLDPTVVGTVFDGATALQTPSTAGSSTTPSTSASPSAPATPAMAAPKAAPAATTPKAGGTTSKGS
jgi:type II secretory pathway pseudopilin PulG